MLSPAKPSKRALKLKWSRKLREKVGVFWEKTQQVASAFTTHNLSFADIIKGNSEPSPQQPVRPARRGEKRCFIQGEILIMLGHYGWIMALEDIDYPDMEKTAGRVYFKARDVLDKVALNKGDVVSFFLYADDQGLGAECVHLEQSASPQMSADADEFVPSNLKAEAQEFVPCTSNSFEWSDDSTEFLPEFNAEADEFVPSFDMEVAETEFVCSFNAGALEFTSSLDAEAAEFTQAFDSDGFGPVTEFTGGFEPEAVDSYMTGFNCEAEDFMPGCGVEAQFNSAAAEFIPPFNADAAEFTPSAYSSMNVDAQEFKPAQRFVPNQSVMMFNPAFLSDSESDDESSHRGNDGDKEFIESDKESTCSEISCPNTTAKVFDMSPMSELSTDDFPPLKPSRAKVVSDNDSTSAGGSSDSEDEPLVHCPMRAPPGLSLPAGWFPPPGLSLPEAVA